MAALVRRSHQRTLQYLRYISSTAVYNDSVDITAANKEGSVAVQDERLRQVSLLKSNMYLATQSCVMYLALATVLQYYVVPPG